MKENMQTPYRKVLPQLGIEPRTLLIFRCTDLDPNPGPPAMRQQCLSLCATVELIVPEYCTPVFQGKLTKGSAIERRVKCCHMPGIIFV